MLAVSSQLSYFNRWDEICLEALHEITGRVCEFFATIKCNNWSSWLEKELYQLLRGKNEEHIIVFLTQCETVSKWSLYHCSRAITKYRMQSLLPCRWISSGLLIVYVPGRRFQVNLFYLCDEILLQVSRVVYWRACILIDRLIGALLNYTFSSTVKR